MLTPTPAGSASGARCRDIALATVVLLLGFAPGLFMAPFLGYQAWWSFAEPEFKNPIWGALCGSLILAPFLGALVVGRWQRGKGAGIPEALLVSGLAAFSIGVASFGVIPFMYLMLALAM
ncbi:hypothetical protein [Nocardioides sp.]|uniref:hypothetical protein n=1 Tax=Nocardioides sp. TaxID=35761 RepID=UPI002C35E5A9|nr:hypothetical protein [Nocardioides sp.]HSX66258.1 hypothetical protein [Nocardioides sp.]